MTTSVTDGRLNWDIVKKAVYDSASAATNYPAFYWCNNYTGGGLDAGSWYLPAIDELTQIYFNNTAINDALELLIDANVSASVFETGWYWSSSQFQSIGTFAWYVSFDDGDQYGLVKNGLDMGNNLKVRAMTKVSE